ncbi:fimbrial protein [Vibrio rumoiensis]|uniref:Fimbrial protein n=1 Tax=Vibrio rumoiensis TaxID=76258 RepID=A0ABW7IX60_9VIBR
MKKIALLSAVFAAAAITNVQAADTGTITFNGTLTASTCDVAVEGQASDVMVTLPTVSTSNLASVGETAGSTPFSMSLSGCTGTLTTASAFFEAGTSVDPSTGRLKNTGGDAGLVSLQLKDGSNDEVIKAGSSEQIANTTFVDVASGEAVLPYAVEYFAEGTTTAGTVSSSVTYSIQYK